MARKEPRWMSSVVQRVTPIEDIRILSRADGEGAGDGRTVEAYAAVFDTPTEICDWEGDYLEKIDRGAFDKTLKEREGKIGYFYNHARTIQGIPSDTFSVPLGRIAQIRTDKRGLWVQAQYNRTDLADQILEAIRHGDVNGMSFSGAMIKSDPDLEFFVPNRNGELMTVTRLEIALTELGPCPFPAYEEAGIVGVRSQQFERTACPTHHTAVDEGTWDAGANVAHLDSPVTVAVARQVYALYDGTRVDNGEIVKTACSLPHHFVSADGHPGAASIAGVRNALSRLPQTQGYSDSDIAAAKAHLQAHLDDYNAAHAEKSNVPEGDKQGVNVEPADVTQRGKIDPEHNSTQTPEVGRIPTPGPQETVTRGAAAGKDTSTDRGKGMPDNQERMTVEQRANRLTEIKSRLTEINHEYAGAELPSDARAEWDGLLEEQGQHVRAIADAKEREAELQALAEADQQESSRTGTATGTRQGRGYEGVTHRAPAAHTTQDIYDLASIRSRAYNIADMPRLYRDNAMRAVEQARFPDLRNNRRQKITSEDIQEHIERLLDTVDDKQGTLAERLLVTGSPQYNRAFGKIMTTLSTASLTPDEQRALAVGSGSTGGYAVPFQLDPTIILTSDGTINPLRQISRVEQITGKEWDGVTSAGITVSRGTEGSEAADGTPALTQPTVKAERVQGFVPFSMEIEQDWAGMRGEITRMLQDAKDMEEASSFVNGNGTAPAPDGLLHALTVTSDQTVAAGSATALDLDDLDTLEDDLPPRWRQRASYLAARAFYVAVRNLARQNASAAGDPWVAVSTSPTGKELNGFPSAEASEMGFVLTTGQPVAILGDFNQYLIVDRLGMTIELVPHLFATANNRPSGQRGIYAIWRNNAKVLVPGAFRVLKMA